MNKRQDNYIIDCSNNWRLYVSKQMESNPLDGSLIDAEVREEVDDTIEAPSGNGNQAPSGSTEYICSTCNNKYKQKNSLKRHMKSHNRANSKCTACHLYFENPQSLQAHNDNKHSASYLCNDCGKAFSRK